MDYHRQQKVMKMLYVFVMSLWLQGCQNNVTIQCQSIRYNQGSAALIKDNIALTASHCVRDDDEVLYLDDTNDFAIVRVPNLLSSEDADDVTVVISSEVMQVTDYYARPGESGSPYIRDGNLYGVMIGVSNDKTIISPINKKAYKVIKEVVYNGN